MPLYGAFAAGDHMVQKPPYWRANCALGNIKRRKFKFNCFVLGVPVRNLLSSMAVFVPCDHQMQRAHNLLQYLHFRPCRLFTVKRFNPWSFFVMNSRQMLGMESESRGKREDKPREDLRNKGMQSSESPHATPLWIVFTLQCVDCSILYCFGDTQL